jgi:hypothetical protein
MRLGEIDEGRHSGIEQRAKFGARLNLVTISGILAGNQSIAQ